MAENLERKLWRTWMLPTPVVFGWGEKEGGMRWARDLEGSETLIVSIFFNELHVYFVYGCHALSYTWPVWCVQKHRGLCGCFTEAWRVWCALFNKGNTEPLVRATFHQDMNTLPSTASAWNVHLITPRHICTVSAAWHMNTKRQSSFQSLKNSTITYCYCACTGPCRENRAPRVCTYSTHTCRVPALSRICRGGGYSRVTTKGGKWGETKRDPTPVDSALHWEVHVQVTLQ